MYKFVKSIPTTTFDFHIFFRNNPAKAGCLLISFLFSIYIIFSTICIELQVSELVTEDGRKQTFGFGFFFRLLFFLVFDMNGSIIGL